MSAPNMKWMCEWGAKEGWDSAVEWQQRDSARLGCKIQRKCIRIQLIAFKWIKIVHSNGEILLCQPKMKEKNTTKETPWIIFGSWHAPFRISFVTGCYIGWCFQYTILTLIFFLFFNQFVFHLNMFVAVVVVNVSRVLFILVVSRTLFCFLFSCY